MYVCPPFRPHGTDQPPYQPIPTNPLESTPDLPRVYEKRVYELDPEKELGVPRCSIEDLRGGAFYVVY